MLMFYVEYVQFVLSLSVLLGSLIGILYFIVKLIFALKNHFKGKSNSFESIKGFILAIIGFLFIMLAIFLPMISIPLLVITILREHNLSNSQKSFLTKDIKIKLNRRK